MEKSCNSCSSCNKFTIWVALSLVAILAILFIFQAQNAFGQSIVTIPSEASEPRCTEGGSCLFPSKLTIGDGETRIWSNDDISIHTVASANSEVGPNEINDEVILPCETFSQTFTEVAQNNYLCSVIF